MVSGSPLNDILCPVCGGGRIGSPFPTLSGHRECLGCGLIWNLDAADLANPNSAYEGGDDPASVDSLRKQEGLRERYYDLWISRISKWVPGGGRILEIGSGTGGLLKHLLGAGWQAEGMEPSAALRAYAIESGVPEECLNHTALDEAISLRESEPYDAVIALDVIEHLPDFTLLPRMAQRLLNPGGVLILQTPNSQSLRRKLQGIRWEQLAPEKHFVLHSPKSLRRVLEREGFGIVKLATVSGTATDGILRGTTAAVVGCGLRAFNLGNGILCVARKIER